MQHNSLETVNFSNYYKLLCEYTTALLCDFQMAIRLKEILLTKIQIKVEYL